MTHSSATRLPLFGRRREFLVSRATQLRLGLSAAGLAILLLVPLNLVLDAATRAGTEALLVDAPGLARPLEERDRWQARLVLGGSVIFVLGVFVLGVLESHRTAGAARSLARSADALADGRLDTRVRLRRGDALVGLADRFNEMAATLATCAAQDERDLEVAATEVERLGASPGASAVAARLREIAARRRPPGVPSA
jgi:methyl-accepting chemotaxis protein